MVSEEPTGIRVDRQGRTVCLTWNDIGDTVIDWTVLRVSCPCAQCQGEFRSHEPDFAELLKTAAELDLVDLLIVGRYAVQPEWRSGHDTGIYTWEYLREIGESMSRSDSGRP